jgi:hypothetical protein
MANLIIWNSYTTVNPGNPKRPVRPLGPHVLAAWLIKHGYTVKVLDFCNLMDPIDLLEITMQHVDSSTIAIGVSNTFWGRKLHSSFFEPDWLVKGRALLESKFPNLEWIMGGYNTEREYRIHKFRWHQMSNRFAEDMLLKFLDERSSKLITRTEFDIATSESRYMDGLGITPHEVLPLEIARGCQFKCLFCVYDVGKQKNSYIKDMKNLENELISNYEKYGTTRYIIVEETVNESKEKIEHLAELVARLPFKFEWVGFNRLDLIGTRPGDLEAIEASGMKGSFFGIESFNPSTSRKVGKAWNGTHGKDYLLYLRERWDNKISWTLSFIVGLLDDTEEDLDETQAWLIENKMFNWAWWPLFVKNKNLHYTNRHTSLLNELDLNHEEYGYTFYDEYNWKNQYWTLPQADKKAAELRKQANPYLTTNVWSATEIASTGFPLVETLFKKSNTDLDYLLIDTAVTKMVDDYVAYQKTISF